MDWRTRVKLSVLLFAAGVFSVKDPKKENHTDGKTGKVIGESLVEFHRKLFFGKGNGFRL